MKVSFAGYYTISEWGGYRVPRLVVEKTSWEVRSQIQELDNLDKDEASKVNDLRCRVVANAQLAAINKTLDCRKRKMPGVERPAVGKSARDSTLGALAVPRTIEGGIVTPSSPQQLSSDTPSAPAKRRKVVGVTTREGVWNPRRRDFSSLSTPRSSNPKKVETVTSTPASSTTPKPLSSVSSVSSLETSKVSGLSTDDSATGYLMNAVDDHEASEALVTNASNELNLNEAVDVLEATEALEASGDSAVAAVDEGRVCSLPLKSIALSACSDLGLLSLRSLALCSVLCFKWVESLRDRENLSNDEKMPCKAANMSLRDLAYKKLLEVVRTCTLDGLSHYVRVLCDPNRCVSPQKSLTATTSELSVASDSCSVLSSDQECSSSKRKRTVSGPSTPAKSLKMNTVSRKFSGLKLTPS